MKRLLLFLAALPLTVSCSNDNDNDPQTPFFNLHEGNMWVYRRYLSDGQGQNPTPTNIVDTVRVVGQEVIDGQSYYKLSHSDSTWPEYLRIDDEGHLVNNQGYVWHPGTDAEYTYSSFFDPYGTNLYQLGDSYGVEIGDNSYMITPYIGYFTPSEGFSIPEGVGEIRAYQQGIGMIFDRCRYLASQAYYEERLEYYELN